MGAVAAPRMVGGQSWKSPIDYVVAGGFDRRQAQDVINAYKAYFGQGKGDWVDWVTSKTGVARETAIEIMRRYRKYYGK